MRVRVIEIAVVIADAMHFHLLLPFLSGGGRTGNNADGNANEIWRSRKRQKCVKKTDNNLQDHRRK